MNNIVLNCYTQMIGTSECIWIHNTEEHGIFAVSFCDESSVDNNVWGIATDWRGTKWQLLISFDNSAVLLGI